MREALRDTPDVKSKKVLTLCYMNNEALEKTMKEGKIYVFRRSKGKLMLKGEGMSFADQC